MQSNMDLPGVIALLNNNYKFTALFDTFFCDKKFNYFLQQEMALGDY